MENPHERAESWSLTFHRAIAERLLVDPAAVLSHARTNLARLEVGDRAARRYVEQWRRLLDGPRENLIAALTDPGQRSRDLRQCSPFAGILDPAERWSLFRRWRAERGRPSAVR